MKNKTISDAKLKANQTNAQKSTGPKTPRGKRFSRRNALKHGLCSQELLIPEADAPEFIELQRNLELQFKAASKMQSLAFDWILARAWSCKLKTRLAHRQLAKVLESADPSKADTNDAVADPRLSRWWGADRLSIRAGIKGLDYARLEFETIGYFRENTKEFLSRAFGPEFLEIVTHWAPSNKQAALLANMLAAHAANFGGDVYPPGLQTPPNTVLDPTQPSQMVVKLLNLRRSFLEETLKIREQKQPDVELDRLSFDFNPRFVAAASRELRRAVDWFFQLQEMGM